MLLLAAGSGRYIQRRPSSVAPPRAEMPAETGPLLGNRICGRPSDVIDAAPTGARLRKRSIEGGRELIILARYPIDTMPSPRTPLDFIRADLDGFAPKEVALHLLPFFPSSGDDGFAIDAWDAIDPTFGDWASLAKLAASRPLLVDAVLNHVGKGHEVVRAFQADPTSADDLVFGYPAEVEGAPASPRGGSVLRAISTARGERFVWCSFTDAAVDINLESDRIRSRVDAFFGLLREQGVWAVRLDAVAYYKKDVGLPLRHVPGVHALAAAIADQAKEHGLRVFAQIDADDLGRPYFDEARHHDIGLFDFGFPVLVLLAFFQGGPHRLVTHLCSVDEGGRRIIRSPRTHDGILLRSVGLQPLLPEILEMAEAVGVAIRSEGGTPYELNTSLPGLLRILLPELNTLEVRRTLRMIMFLTAMASDDAYFYLPSVLDHVAEDCEPREEPSRIFEPRTVNRTPMPLGRHDEFLREEGARLNHALGVMVEIHRDPTPRRYRVQDGLLHVERGAWRAVFNFAREEAQLPAELRRAAAASEGVTDDRLAPRGYCVVAMSEEETHASPSN